MPKKKLPEDIRAYFAKEGAKGGKIGGTKRSASMTPEERTALAKKAAAARWKKAKRTPAGKGGLR